MVAESLKKKKKERRRREENKREKKRRSEERGEESIPEISPGGQYLICALTYSNPPDSAESKSDQELEEERQEITRALEQIIDPVVNDINIGIILLQDCSITVISVYSPKGPEYRPGWVRNHPQRHTWVDK